MINDWKKIKTKNVSLLTNPAVAFKFQISNYKLMIQTKEKQSMLTLQVDLKV